MRSMLKLPAVCVALGMLLVSAQSAQACHGRRGCWLCASKAYGGGYGYGNVGYGYAPPTGAAYGYVPPTGYGPNYSYAYPYNYYRYGPPGKSEPRDGEEPTPISPAAVGLAERLARLERRVDEDRVFVDTGLRALGRRVDEDHISEDTKLKALDAKVDGLGKDLNARLDKIQAALDKLTPPTPTPTPPTPTPTPTPTPPTPTPR